MGRICALSIGSMLIGGVMLGCRNGPLSRLERSMVFQPRCCQAYVYPVGVRLMQIHLVDVVDEPASGRGRSQAEGNGPVRVQSLIGIGKAVDLMFSHEEMIAP